MRCARHTLPAWIAGTLFAASPILADYKQVRMAFYFTDAVYGISDHFLARTRALGYTHILADLNFENSGSCDLVPNGVVQTRLRDAFLKVDAYGMRLIPHVQTASKWSWHWQACNSGIPFNEGAELNRGPTFYRSTPFDNAPNDAMDIQFKSLLNRVRDAFNAAKPSLRAPFPPTLEYIHIGHDEGALYMNTSTNEALPDVLIMGHFNGRDQDFVRNAILTVPPFTESGAFQALMAKEVMDWVDRTDAVTDLGSTKLLIWADLWDPQQNGKAAWNSFLNHGKVVVTSGVLDLPGLNATQKNRLKSKVVLMPWQYEKCYLGSTTTCNTAHWDYNTASALGTMRDAGFSYIFAFAITDGNAAISTSRWHQFKEVIAALKSSTLQSKMLGFCANAFPGTGDEYWNRPYAFTYHTYEYLPYWLGIRSPVVNTAILHNMIIN